VRKWKSPLWAWGRHFKSFWSLSYLWIVKIFQGELSPEGSINLTVLCAEEKTSWSSFSTIIDRTGSDSYRLTILGITSSFRTRAMEFQRTMWGDMAMDSRLSQVAAYHRCGIPKFRFGRLAFSLHFMDSVAHTCRKSLREHVLYRTPSFYGFC